MKSHHIILLIILSLLTLTFESLATPLDPVIEGTIEIVLMGDIAFNGRIQDKVRSDGAEYPFEHIRPYIESSDLRLANLETPVSNGGEREEGKYSTFRADPMVIESLLYADIDGVSLANNHCLDYGPEALNDTLDLLEDANIDHSGIWYGYDDNGTTSLEGCLIIEKDDWRVGLLACTEDVRDHWAAKAGRAGPVPLEKDLLVRMIGSLRPNVDILIVSVHWRKWPQYTTAPEPGDRALCHAFIDAGADIIMGHGPHTVHEVEGYNGGLILYSLGNIAMKNGNESAERSYIAKVLIDSNGISSLQLIPVALGSYRYVPMGTPLDMTGAEGFDLTYQEVMDMYRTDYYGLIGNETERSALYQLWSAFPCCVRGLIVSTIASGILALILAIILIRRGLARSGSGPGAHLR